MHRRYVKNNVNECCGCTVCSTLCPKQCIQMTADSRGFVYPEIDYARCVNCGLCRKVCSFNENARKNHPFQQLGVHHRNLEERRTSRSGAVFMALGNFVLHNQGAIYGVAYDSNLDVKHIRAENRTALNSMKGSKYVQSDISEIWEALENDLRNNKWVLVSGTACQIAAINSFVENKKLNDEHLITCDIICHGVPSPKVFRDYLKLLESKFDAKVTSFNFRDKRFGWRPHYETFKMDNGNEYFSQIYTNLLFYSNATLRPSCLTCPFTKTDRPGDFTIGDLWGGKSLGDWIDDIGNSLVFVNTEKAKKIFQSIENELDVRILDMSDCMQPNLMHPTAKGKYYDLFWENYSQYGLKAAIEKLDDAMMKSISMKQRIRFRIKRVLKPIYVMKKLGLQNGSII